MVFSVSLQCDKKAWNKDRKQSIINCVTAKFAFITRSVMVRFQVRKIDVLDTFLGITEACGHLAGGPANVHAPSGLRHGEGGWGTLNWGSHRTGVLSAQQWLWVWANHLKPPLGPPSHKSPPWSQQSPVWRTRNERGQCSRNSSSWASGGHWQTLTRP